MVVNKMGYAFSGMTIRGNNRASWVTGLVYFGKDVETSWFYVGLYQVLFCLLVNEVVSVHSVYVYCYSFLYVNSDIFI